MTQNPLPRNNSTAHQGGHRVALYVRQNIHGLASVEAQQATLREYLRLHHPDWRVVATYHDIASCNESLTRRPGLRSALRAASSGEFDILMAPETSNLTRRMTYLNDIAQRLEAASVALMTADGGLDTTTTMGRFLVTMIDAVTNYERAQEQRRAEWEHQEAQRRPTIGATSIPATPPRRRHRVYLRRYTS